MCQSNLRSKDKFSADWTGIFNISMSMYPNTLYKVVLKTSLVQNVYVYLNN